MTMVNKTGIKLRSVDVLLALLLPQTVYVQGRMAKVR
jgi:hypothetical protein